jgi:hypothetical protein
VLVPEGDDVPDEGEVVVRAVATWPGQGVFRQEREFAFNVYVVGSSTPARSWLPPTLAAGLAALLLWLLTGRRIAKSPHLY